MVAQHHDVLVAEIGDETLALVEAPPGPLIVVIGDVPDHLECMLVERQQPRFLHRNGTPGDRVGVDHAVDVGAGHMDRAGDREAPAVELGIRALDRVPVDVELHQRGGGDLVVQHAESVDQEMILRPRDPCGYPGIDQIRPAEQIDETIAGGEVDPRLPLRLARARRLHRGYGHRGSSDRGEKSAHALRARVKQWVGPLDGRSAIFALASGAKPGYSGCAPQSRIWTEPWSYPTASRHLASKSTAA